MGLKYQKFQNGDKVVYSGGNNQEVYYYVGLNPLNPELSFLCKTNEELVIIYTDVLNEGYEHYERSGISKLNVHSGISKLIEDDLGCSNETINKENRLKRSLEVLESLKGFKKTF